MKILIVSTAPFIFKNNETFAYSPYVNELAVFNKFSDEISFCCPVWQQDKGLLISKLPFNYKNHFELIDSNILTCGNVFKAVFQSVYNTFTIFKAMRKADHIHLRCPGNMALLACFVQMFFPSKIKSAKYAGNWDPESKKPWSYKMQQFILENTFLTRNMQVLVYGEWKNQSKNIKSSFTATYTESEKENVYPKSFESKIEFIFVGSLVTGKNPLYAIKIIEQLEKQGYDVILSLYGEGKLRKVLKNYVYEQQLQNIIFFYGNQDHEIIKKAYKKSHFVILPSKSEGWPKAIAEGMFWGCVPLATKVSCVPFMLDYGNRGILLDMDLDIDVGQINNIINDEINYQTTSKLAANWSRNYTIDVFESEIKKLLKK